MRLVTETDPSVVGRVATAIGHAGGVVTAIDVAESRHDRLVIDVTCSATNGEHAEEILSLRCAGSGATVHKVSDRTFLLHIGGKIEVASKVPLETRDDLSMAYTPGVARVARRSPDTRRRRKLRSSATSSRWSPTARGARAWATSGPARPLPVMEGKAALFKRFAGIDAWPICLRQQDVDEIVRTVERIAPGFGGINLEDISAPRCFEIEARLQAASRHPRLPRRPARYGDRGAGRADQRPRFVGKRPADLRRGGRWPAPAGTAIVTLLLAAGARHLVGLDRKGSTVPGRRAALAGQRRSPSTPTPEAARRLTRAARRRRLHRGPAADLLPAEHLGHAWPRPDRVRPGQSRPRGEPTRPRAPPSSPPGAATTRTRSTTSWHSPCSSGRLDARARDDITPEMTNNRRGGCARRRRHRRAAEPLLHRAERFDSSQVSAAVAAAVRRRRYRPAPAASDDDGLGERTA